MKKKWIQQLCIGGIATIASLTAFGQAATSVTEDFNNNQVPSAFRAGQGYFISASDGVLKVRAGKQLWEEFSYDATLNLVANPRVSFKIRADIHFELTLALLASDGTNNRFPESLNAVIFPSKEFIDVSFDMASLLKIGTNPAVDASKVSSIRFVVEPAGEKTVNIEIDDFKVGAAAQSFPRLIAPMTQTVFANSGQQTVLLRGMLAGSTTTAVSSNPSLVPNPTIGAVNARGVAELKYTPAAGQSGTSKVTITVSQAGKTNLVFPIDIVVNANLAPTINEVPALTIGSGQSLEVALSGIGDGNTEKVQNISFTATSSDQSALKDAEIKVDYTSPFTSAKLTFKTEQLASGTKDVNITLTVKDDGGTASGGVDTKTLIIPVKIYAVYYKSPTIAPIANNNFAFIGTTYTVPFVSLTDGNGGTKIASITATSSNTAAADNPVVSYTPGSNSGFLTYTLKNKQLTTFSVIITNTGAPANSNGNSSTTVTFTAKGTDPAYTSYIEDFQTYGVDGKPVTPNVLGSDYYSSGVGGQNRVTWMTNLETYDHKWFLEGQGSEQTLTLNPANKSATIVLNKPSQIPRTFAGIWFTPRKLFDLSSAKYLSMRVSASPGTTVTFDIFDVNDKRYGLLDPARVNATGGVYTFAFDKAPQQADFDFSKIACVLINVSNMITYNGTVTISELKIGTAAEGAPAPLPASINMQPLANRTIFAGSSGLDVLLSDVKVLKDGINQNANITLNVTSSNNSLIPNPPAPVVSKEKALIRLKPSSGTGASTITVTASAPGVANRVYTFQVNIINKNVATAGTVTINANQTFQTISGIGIATEGGLSESRIEDIVADMGASMLRFDIGGEYEPGLEAIQNDNSDPFVLDITKFKYSDRTDFRMTKAKGCDRVIGCVWTPPIWMKGQLTYRPQVQFGFKNSLLLEMYDEFAEYILGACLAFKNQFGYEMYSVCLQNEAEFYASANYTATCGYTREQAAEVVRRVYPRLKAAGLTTRIHGFDQLPAQGNVLNWFSYFNNNDTRDMFDAFSIHAYGENAVDPANLDDQTMKDYYAECQRVNPKKELWMTETSGEPAGEAGGVREFSSQFGAFANNLSAWVPFGNRKTDGMRFYAMKNFAKFIKPGAVRVGAINSGGAAGLAFKHTANNTFTVVLANTTNSPQQVKLAGSGIPAKMYAYLTSNNINCQLFDSLTSADNYLVYLPANSVMTLFNKFEDVTANESSIATNMELIAYPNPTKGELNLLLPQANFSEIRIIDITGRVVMSQTVKSNGNGEELINLSGLNKGIYFVTVKGDVILRKKIVVE